MNMFFFKMLSTFVQVVALNLYIMHYPCFFLYNTPLKLSKVVNLPMPDLRQSCSELVSDVLKRKKMLVAKELKETTSKK